MESVSRDFVGRILTANIIAHRRLLRYYVIFCVVNVAVATLMFTFAFVTYKMAHMSMAMDVASISQLESYGLFKTHYLQLNKLALHQFLSNFTG